MSSNRASDFIAFLEAWGCTVEVTQPDDGSGYSFLLITLPDGVEIVGSVDT